MSWGDDIESAGLPVEQIEKFPEGPASAINAHLATKKCARILGLPELNPIERRLRQRQLGICLLA